jgi:ubiquitin carboxyl-terminal hydrolase 48
VITTDQNTQTNTSYVCHVEYFRKTGCKKKLNTSIWFPEVLNMKEYVDINMEGRGICSYVKQPKVVSYRWVLWDFVFNFLGCVYDLTAVLIHRGLSAYSGHYIAHIKDKEVHII